MRWECERGCGDGGGVKLYAIADFHQPSAGAPITFMASTSHRTKPTLRALVTARSPPAHVGQRRHRPPTSHRLTHRCRSVKAAKDRIV